MREPSDITQPPLNVKSSLFRRSGGEIKINEGSGGGATAASRSVLESFAPLFSCRCGRGNKFFKSGVDGGAVDEEAEFSGEISEGWLFGAANISLL